ncbi:unnamed protein product [Darwinula stevensoni]|uniref:WD repeat domain-containing protein 83 n=1 Tax=Darwinula stevensoni TaxID=69355 RepID=A0A7R8XDT0_9CRUS|nr:unnamed protein product [Darwinula stevensoni]CAG0894626.1 unnamed protein product [Darwinula stevensoni]
MEIPNKLLYQWECKQGAVRACRFNVDGNYCLTCGGDKSIKLWNPHKGLHLKSYIGHGMEVLDARGSCDNSQVASGSADKTVSLWDVTSGNVMRKWRGHVGKVTCIAFNEESTVVLSGSIDGSIRAWDVKSHKKDSIQVMHEPKDSVTSLKVTQYEIFVASLDKRIRKYDLRNGELVTDYIGQPVMSLEQTRDGQCLLLGCTDSTIKLFDKDTGELLQEFTGHKNLEYRIESVISACDRLVLSGSEDGKIYIWDLVEGSVKETLGMSGGHTIHSLSFHPMKQLFLSASQETVALWGTEENSDKGEESVE